MLSSTRLTRFLLDENVRAELEKFLRRRRLNLRLAVKGSSDQFLARVSKREKRVFVTNDTDFTILPADKIFSVIWLRLPQNNPDLLIVSFEKLLMECKNFQSRIIILEPWGWSSLPLPKETQI